MIKNNLPHCHSADLAMEVDEAMDGDGQDEGHDSGKYILFLNRYND